MRGWEINSAQGHSLSGNHSRGPKPRGLPMGLHSVTIRSVRTKILGITGVTVGLILWAWALNWTAQIVSYGYWRSSTRSPAVIKEPS
jgi:hypothetical protein